MADFLKELINEYNSGLGEFSIAEAKEFKKEILKIAKSEKRDISHLFNDIKKSAPPKKVIKTPTKKVVVKTIPTPKKTAPKQSNEAVKIPTKPEVKKSEPIAPVKKGEEEKDWLINHPAPKVSKEVSKKLENLKNRRRKLIFETLPKEEERETNTSAKLGWGSGMRLSKLPNYQYVNRVNYKINEIENEIKKLGGKVEEFEEDYINGKKKIFPPKDFLLNQSAPKVSKEKAKPEVKKVYSSKVKMLRGDDTILETPAEEITGYYAIMELDDIIQSHDEVTFDWNKKYPKQCQERDYRQSSEKDKVLSFANNFKPNLLVNDNPEAMSGPSVINPDGVVLGGNGRIMILKVVHRNGRFFTYENYLGKKASEFGFSEEDIKLKFKNPVLVRVVDVPLSRCMFYSRLLNENLSREKDDITNSLSLSKSLSQKSFVRIANLFEGEDSATFREVVDSSKNQKEIIEILRRAGIITSSNSPKWIDKDGRLTNGAKSNLENLLLAKILPSQELIETAKEYTNRIMKAIPVLIKIQQLPEEYDLIPVLQDVIKFESRRREQGLSIKQFLNQESMFGASDKPETMTAMLWLALASGVNKFRQILESYYTSAKNNASEDTMFGFEKSTPTAILTKIVDVKGLSDRFQISEKEIDSGFIKKGGAVYGFYGKDCKFYYIAGANFSNQSKSFIKTAMYELSAYNKKHSGVQSKIYKFINKKDAERKLNGLLLASGYYKNNAKNVQLTLANRPKRNYKSSGLSSNGVINHLQGAKKVITSKKPFWAKMKELIRY